MNVADDYDQIAERLSVRNFSVIDGGGSNAPLAAISMRFRRPEQIPPRKWVYGRFLVRQYMSLLVAPGGAGKTAWAVAAAASIALGKPLMGDKVHVPGNVLFAVLEDPLEEFERRVSAFCLHTGIPVEDLDDRIIAIDGRKSKLCIARLSEDGVTVVYPDERRLCELCIEHHIVAIFVDPCVRSHEVQENSNDQMDAMAAAWGRVAERANCAVMLIHHTKKGAIAGDIDSSRGGSSLAWAARVAITLSRMPSEFARQVEIEEEARWRYLRVHDAKENLAPPSEKANWLKLASVKMDNPTIEYPDGDYVQAIEPWEPPSLWDGLPLAVVVHALQALSHGPGGGELYSLKHDADRWAGVLLISQGKSEAQAAAILRAWVDNGVIFEEPYRSPSQRRDRRGVRVNPAKLAEMEGALAGGRSDA